MNEGLLFLYLSCCRGPSSISSGDLDKILKLRAGVIISQDSDLHLQEEQNQEHWPAFPYLVELLPPAKKQEGALLQTWLLFRKQR